MSLNIILQANILKLDLQDLLLATQAIAKYPDEDQEVELFLLAGLLGQPPKVPLVPEAVRLVLLLLANSQAVLLTFKPAGGEEFVIVV